MKKHSNFFSVIPAEYAPGKTFLIEGYKFPLKGAIGQILAYPSVNQESGSGESWRVEYRVSEHSPPLRPNQLNKHSIPDDQLKFVNKAMAVLQNIVESERSHADAKLIAAKFLDNWPHILGDPYELPTADEEGCRIKFFGWGAVSVGAANDPNRSYVGPFEPRNGSNRFDESYTEDSSGGIRNQSAGANIVDTGRNRFLLLIALLTLIVVLVLLLTRPGCGLNSCDGDTVNLVNKNSEDSEGSFHPGAEGGDITTLSDAEVISANSQAGDTGSIGRDLNKPVTPAVLNSVGSEPDEVAQKMEPPNVGKTETSDSAVAPFNNILDGGLDEPQKKNIIPHTSNGNSIAIPSTEEGVDSQGVINPSGIDEHSGIVTVKKPGIQVPAYPGTGSDDALVQHGDALPITEGISLDPHKNDIKDDNYALKRPKSSGAPGSGANSRNGATDSGQGTGLPADRPIADGRSNRSMGNETGNPVVIDDGDAPPHLSGGLESGQGKNMGRETIAAPLNTPVVESTHNDTGGEVGRIKKPAQNKAGSVFDPTGAELNGKSPIASVEPLDPNKSDGAMNGAVERAFTDEDLPNDDLKRSKNPLINENKTQETPASTAAESEADLIDYEDLIRDGKGNYGDAYPLGDDGVTGINVVPQKTKMGESGTEEPKSKKNSSPATNDDNESAIPVDSKDTGHQNKNSYPQDNNLNELIHKAQVQGGLAPPLEFVWRIEKTSRALEPGAKLIDIIGLQPEDPRFNKTLPVIVDYKLIIRGKDGDDYDAGTVRVRYVSD